VRENALVADITALLGDLPGWPPHHRVIARKEPLHPRYGKDASAYKIKHKARDQTFALPSRKLNVNAAWLTATTLAADLRCWFQLLALDGEMARATPKTLRYRVLHVSARLVHGQRKRRLKLPDTWPWADIIIRAFQRTLALPHPT
jgi:hypothetical protein